MKRANGSGSISYIGPHRRRKYAVKVSYKDDDGIIHQKCLGTYETKAAAQAWLEAYNTDRLRGVIAPDPGAVTVTIGELWDCWSRRELANASAKKRGNYEGPWNRILSKYKDKPIRKMRADDWQAIIDADVAAGSAPGTVGKLKVLISALSRYAVERDYIAKDYTAFVKLPEAKAVHEKGRLTDAQVEQVAQMAADGVKYADIVLILCYMGCRIEELLQLKSGDYCPDFGGYFTGGSKTDAGKDRIMPVHPRIAPYVQAWMDHGKPYVFHSARSADKPMPYVTALAGIKSVLSDIGLPAGTAHWCRYTWISRAEEAGIDEVTRRRICGHSDKDVTAHYTILSPEHLCEAMRKIP